MQNYILIFISSFLCSLAFILVFKWLFYKLEVLDNPEKYRMKRAPVPYAMGVIFFMAFLIISYFFVEYNYKLGLIWVFGFFVTGLSFGDDLLNLSPKVRLIFQIIIGAIIGVTSIKIGYVSNIFGGIINLETYYFTIFNHTIFIIPLLFTIIWYVFIFNALNWSDGIQGNTAGISAISFLILFFLGIILFFRDKYEGGVENAIFIMKTSLILVGILIPFWWFDFHEKILMGDSGTMFLGFMLATLAIIAGGKIATVLVVFGIYSVDAIYVIIKRILNKKNPLKGDFTHLHHRLLNIGLTKNQVLGSIYSLSFLFGLTALFLDKTGKIIVFGIIVVVVVFINKIMETLILKKSKKKQAFTLVELLVSVTIVILISGVSVGGFFHFLDNREANAKITEFESKIKNLDKLVENKEISDYELKYYDSGSFVVYENIIGLDDDYIKLDNIQNYTGSLMFKNGKLEAFTGSLEKNIDYRIEVFSGSTKLNNIELIRLDKENGEFKFVGNNLEIKNIGGRKEFKIGNEKQENLEINFIYKDREYNLNLKLK